MKTIACTFALLFALASPALAQPYHGGGYGGHGGHEGHGGGMGGFHERDHGGYEHRHFHGHGGYGGGVYYGCTPWQFAAGACGPDY